MRTKRERYEAIAGQLAGLVAGVEGPVARRATAAALLFGKLRDVSWAGVVREEPVIVPDVHAFPGHIACSTTTRSEIVVPVLRPDGSLLALLDVDSDQPAAFTDVDRRALEALCASLGRRYA